MYNALKAPLPAEAVKPHPTKTYLSSIKAIYVTERLNDVFGCGAWQIRTQLVTESEKGMVVVKVTLEIPEYGVYYESFGGNDNGWEQSKNFDLWDAYKGATTDWITKIGSYLGIGIAVFQWKGNTQWNNAPTSNETPKEAPILFGNIINEIKEENDSNTLDVMLSVVKEGNWSEKQKAWAIREVDTRKQELKNKPPF